MEAETKIPKNLVIVDCQKDFCNPDGSLYVPGADMVAKEIAAYLDWHYQNFDYITVIHDTHPANHCSFKENGGQWPVHCVKNTEGWRLHDAINDTLSYRTNSCNRIIFIEKGTDPDREEYGAFEDSLPHEYMRHCENIVVGVAGEFCVAETMKNLKKHGCHVSHIPGFIACIDPVEFAKHSAKFPKYSDAETPAPPKYKPLSKSTISIFDTDLYKFTVSYAYMTKYPHAVGTFSFCDRNKTKLTPEQLQELKNRMAEKMHYTENSFDVPIEWLTEKIPYIPQYYWEWLMYSFKLDYSKLNIYLDDDSCLQIECTDNLYKSTLYEIPVLYMVSEYLTDLEAKNFDSKDEFRKYCRTTCYRKTMEKIDRLQDNYDFVFSEFGTRRRASLEIQNLVVSLFADHLTPKQFTGTSNVLLAYLYDLTPIGTHPHEWFMFHGAQFGIRHANYLALEAWTDVYRGNLGIALTDTYTTDLFFENFSMMQAKLFDGLRQDSGDEYQFIDKAVKRYQEHKINPLTKAIVFSNGLNLDKGFDILEYGQNKVQCRFGIGTYFTHDLDLGYKPNIVMKLASCAMNNKAHALPAVKISDDEGKHIGDPEELEIALKIIDQVKRRNS